MPVDASFVGHTYPPTAPYRVSREKIREFADAIKDPNPAYRSPDAARALGHPDVIAPPTFPIVLTLPAGGQFLHDPASGIDYTRVVHGDQRFVHERPVHAGDVLQVETIIDDIKTMAGNEVVTIKALVRTVDGELVSTVYGVTVVRGDAQ